jgi:hypothetical protein
VVRNHSKEVKVVFFDYVLAKLGTLSWRFFKIFGLSIIINMLT